MTEAPSTTVAAVRSAFDRGDFATVRALAATELARPAEELPAEDRRAIEALVARTAPGGLAVVVYAIAAAIVLAVAGYWVLHAHK